VIVNGSDIVCCARSAAIISRSMSVLCRGHCREIWQDVRQESNVCYVVSYFVWWYIPVCIVQYAYV